MTHFVSEIGRFAGTEAKVPRPVAGLSGNNFCDLTIPSYLKRKPHNTKGFFLAIQMTFFYSPASSRGRTQPEIGGSYGF